MAGRDLADGALMQLGLSSAAAPDATLSELVRACARRGFAVLELRECDAHGLGPHASPDAIDAALAQLASAGVRVAAYRPIEPIADIPVLAAFARRLGARLLVASDEAAAALHAAGADVARLGAEAWDADPAAAPLTDAAAAFLASGGLRHITLAGAGPEVTLHEGRGVGELMRALALRGWAGSISLVPSSASYRVIWQQWLGRRGGTGCGSKAGEPLVVARTGG